MRYHALSIGAVFLALAIGVVLGSTGLSDRLVSAVSTQRDDLASQVAELRGPPTSSRPGSARPRCAVRCPAGRSR